jgi:hypothetical protein
MTNDTLFGSRILKVQFEDGREAELTIRQFKLRQYQAAFPLLDDEIGLVALAAGTARGVVEAMHPKSFEAAYAAVKEINAEGFFIWSARQMERGAAGLRNLPPEMVERIIVAGKKPTSATPSPLSPLNAA